MYCPQCGRYVGDNSAFCSNCGMRFNNKQNQIGYDDSSSSVFAILGFFIPIVGLILFLIYENQRPKRAKSAGKGALIGFITRIVLSIIFAIIYFVFAASVFGNMFHINVNQYDMYGNDNIFYEESLDDILEKYVDVTFGEFKVSNNGYFSKTSLEITVKNKAETQYSYYITIEAMDANGARLDTDTILVNCLNPGQEIYLTAFEYVDQNKIEQYKNATFRVLDIEKYNY